MSQISKFVFLDKNVLLEYIYDDGNLNGDPYNIVVNVKDQKRSFVNSDSSGTNNITGNQLFRIDPVTNKYGKVGIVDGSGNLQTNYPFLQLKNYPAGPPVRFDTIRIHVPVNYTFGEYIGCYLKVYAYDFTNTNLFELSNFYFDISDYSQSYLLQYESPPLLFQEKLWGKYLEIQVPSIGAIALQRINNVTTPNSINFNLTGGAGLSTTSPVLIDFQFINKLQSINGITTYLLAPKVTTTIPQTPEYEQVGVMIEPSTQGDFFEIYGTYNGDIAEFNKFINDAYYLGNQYYVQYSITLFEQNIQGKTLTITQTGNFNEPIEYRPIIKYSTTTAIIDVEMQLIDAVNSSTILRNASYGMFQKELSKYSLYLSKINIRNATNPKIYNLKSTASPINSNSLLLGGGTTVETVQVPYPVLVDRFDVVSQSKNAQVGPTIYYGNNLLVIVLYPFDNIVQFHIAQNINNSPKFLDMTNLGEIKLVMKSDTILVESKIYTESGEIDLANGLITFKVLKTSYSDLKRIYNSQQNTFYITSTINNVESTIYSGFYKPFDAADNISQMISDAANAQNQGGAFQSAIVQDPNLNTQETAIITRVQQLVSGTSVQSSVSLATASNNLLSSMGNLNFALTGTASS